jgi:hypothetical protein
MSRIHGFNIKSIINHQNDFYLRDSYDCFKKCVIDMTVNEESATIYLYNHLYNSPFTPSETNNHFCLLYPRRKVTIKLMDSFFTNVPKDRGDEEEIDVDKTLTKNISKRKVDGEKSSSTDGHSKKVVKKKDDQKKKSAQNSNQGSIKKKGLVQQSIQFKRIKKDNDHHHHHHRHRH